MTKTALVTGASGGIGRAIVKRLAADGFSVAVHYTGNAEKADEAAQEIVFAGGRAVTLKADMAVAGEVT